MGKAFSPIDSNPERAEQEQAIGIFRDKSGLVVGYDDLVGDMWVGLDSDDPTRQMKAKRIAKAMGFEQYGDGK